MHELRRTLVAVLLVVAACGDNQRIEPDGPRPDAPTDAPPVDAADLRDLPITPEYQGLADAIEAERVANGIANVSALLMLDGEIVFAHGFGSAGRGDGDTVHASTLYRIGSVTKMMTAAALLQDVAAGELDLEAPITTYLPELSFDADPGASETIRVKHLLTHSSALNDFLQIVGSTSDSALASFILGQYESVAYQMAPAGRMWNYSNPNFYLAGLLVEQNGTRVYREVMRDRVFTPLGMTRTHFLASDVLADGDYAIGLTQSSNGSLVPVTPSQYDNAWARPAGYAFSSVYDLAAFYRFLDEGNPAVLPDAQRLAMQDKQIDTQVFGDIVHYGYGLFVRDGFFLQDGFHRTKLVEHGGNIPGFATATAWIPESRFVFITIAGADVGGFDDSLAYAITHHATIPGPTAPPPGLAPVPATFDRYTGSFFDPHNVGRMTVTKVGSELHISMPDLDAANIPYDSVLDAVSLDNFVMSVQGYQFLATFLFDEAGEVEFLRTRSFVLGAAAPARVGAVTVDAERLRAMLQRTPPVSPLMTGPR